MKFEIINFVILIMCIFDILATYNYVNTFNKKFPNLDYKSLEANPILRKSWSIFGLNLGTIIGGLIIFGILTLLVFTISTNWKWFFAGTFSMMLIYHLLNWQQLIKIK